MIRISTDTTSATPRALSRPFAALFALAAMAAFWLPTLTNPAEARAPELAGELAGAAPSTVIVFAASAAPVLM